MPWLRDGAADWDFPAANLIIAMTPHQVALGKPLFLSPQCSFLNYGDNNIYLVIRITSS